MIHITIGNSPIGIKKKEIKKMEGYGKL